MQIYGLNNLVSKFPSSKRLSFHTTAMDISRFPFQTRSSTRKDRTLMADVSVSFPGEVLTRRTAAWSNIALIIDAKSTQAQDPFLPLESGAEIETYSQDVVHLAINARNLMLAHGLLAAFMVGIYGNTVRLVRFDNAGAVVSRAFPLRQRPELLCMFFWRFVHPLEPGCPFVGWDPTVRKITAAEQRWIAARFEKAGKPVPKELPKFRRVLVYDDDGTSEEAEAYFLVQPIYLGKGLFSRATGVWLALRDTCGERGADDETLQLVVVKEAWRHVWHPDATSENDVYERLKWIPEEEYHGLPRHLGGNDLGKRARAQRSVEAEAPSRKRRRVRRGVHRQDDQPENRPSLQETFTWRYLDACDDSYDRTHMRLVVDVVGRPLDQFRSTKEMVTALRDAMIGMCWFY